ncbi:MAG: ABC transporter, permease protein 2 (cluster 1, maltose/g3p/polyamine/iron), partial [uncultured Arthrobacter sp.]
DHLHRLTAQIRLTRRLLGRPARGRGLLPPAAGLAAPRVPGHEGNRVAEPASGVFPGQLLRCPHPGADPVAAVEQLPPLGRLRRHHRAGRGARGLSAVPPPGPVQQAVPLRGAVRDRAADHRHDGPRVQHVRPAGPARQRGHGRAVHGRNLAADGDLDDQELHGFGAGQSRGGRLDRRGERDAGTPHRRRSADAPGPCRGLHLRVYPGVGEFLHPLHPAALEPQAARRRDGVQLLRPVRKRRLRAACGLLPALLDSGHRPLHPGHQGHRRFLRHRRGDQGL